MNHAQPMKKSFPQSHIFTGEVHRDLSQYLSLQRLFFLFWLFCYLLSLWCFWLAVCLPRISHAFSTLIFIDLFPFFGTELTHNNKKFRGINLSFSLSLAARHPLKQQRRIAANSSSDLKICFDMKFWHQSSKILDLNLQL